MKTPSDLDLKTTVNRLYARKRTILIAFLVISSLSAYLAVSLPNVFQSSTVILITPQKLPTSYVNSTVTSSVQQRTRTIIEQILSRGRLEKIIKELNLFSSGAQETTMEERIDQLRKRITTEIRRDETIYLSFTAETPEKAMQVTAKLATLFIDENLQIREQQAVGTTAFMNAEADKLRKELEEKETQVNYYKSQYRNELPEQLDANLRMIEQLRTELQSNMLRLSSLQERNASLEQQLAEGNLMPLFDTSGVAPLDGGQAAPGGALSARKTQLQTLLKQYSEKHPDVIRLKREIKALEAEASTVESSAKGSGSAPEPSRNPLQEILHSQLTDLKSEIDGIQSANHGLKTQIALYQSRIENAPVRAIELAKISRTYEITLKKYQDLLAKTLDSQLSQNMEKSQKGEQIRIIEPANLPQVPIRPNRPLILLVGLLVGLGGGVGLAFLQENWDTSFKREEDLYGYVNAPVLATLPNIITRGSVLEQRKNRQMLALASVAVLTIGLIVIRLFGSSLPGF